MSTETEAAAEPRRAPPSEDPAFIVSVIGAAGDHDGPLLRRLLIALSAPDMADVIEHVPLETALTIARLIGRELPPDMLPELSWERREQILAELPADYVGKALGELDTDDAAAVAADIDVDQLARCSPPTRIRASRRRRSPRQETTGAQQRGVAAPEGASVGDVIDRLRADAKPNCRTTSRSTWWTRPAPGGGVRVQVTLRRTPSWPISRAAPHLISTDMDQEVVARPFRNILFPARWDEAGHSPWSGRRHRDIISRGRREICSSSPA